MRHRNRWHVVRSIALVLMMAGLLGVDVQCPGESEARPSLSDLQVQIDELSARLDQIEPDAARTLGELLGRPDLAETLPDHLLDRFACQPASGPTPDTMTLALDGAKAGTVLGFLGRETISEPYEFVVALRAAAGLKAGQAELRLDRGGVLLRVEGDVTGIGPVASEPGGVVYAIRIQPRLARLGLRVHSRTFAESKSSDVAQTLANEAGVSPDIVASTPIRSLIVQFQESDLAFLTRILERDGVHYLASGDEVIARIGIGGLVPAGTLSYLGGSPTSPPLQYVASLSRVDEFYTSVHTVLGHDPIAKEGLVGTFALDKPPAFGVNESVRFRESIQTTEDARQSAESDAYRVRGASQQYRGTTNSALVRAGASIVVGDRIQSALAGTYFVTGASHAAILDEASNCIRYANAFAGQDATVADYRPPRRTPVPDVHGPMTAVVTNVDDPDGLGRVKLRFLWDTADGVESFWARIAHPSGKLDERVHLVEDPLSPSDATLFVPDVDDEVLVAFLEGDASDPVVIGRLYNGVDTPPVASNQPQLDCTTAKGPNFVVPDGVSLGLPTGFCTTPLRAVSAFGAVCGPDSPPIGITGMTLETTGSGQAFIVNVRNDSGAPACVTPTAVCCQIE